ncbi:hypothetical protein P781_09340 [Vibrio mimicus CAIM 1883]|nr:hypothetical protein P781_09340 [Vibrio mimicus CAIM 1883]ERM56011.1 hypothetical protein P780_09330 [Vibrio mimicus CAIM 1882]
MSKKQAKIKLLFLNELIFLSQFENRNKTQD